MTYILFLENEAHFLKADIKIQLIPHEVSGVGCGGKKKNNRNSRYFNLLNLIQNFI